MSWRKLSSEEELALRLALGRARTHEDFETTYEITPTSCEIVALHPKHSQIREYLPAGARAGIPTALGSAAG